jgi:photosystem II stability/assembly factor-like uncharacterized protein
MNANRPTRGRSTALFVSLAGFITCSATLAAGVNRWTSLGPRSDAFVTALAAGASSAGIVYAGTAGGGVFKSSDGGETWRPVNGGLDDGNVTALAADPSAAGIVYAATAASGVYKTTDGGTTWHAAAGGLGNASISTLAIDPIQPSRLYAGGSLGVYRSTDGGTTWSSVLSGSGVSGLAKGRDSTVYAIVSDGGPPRLYRSDDAGDRWRLVFTYVEPSALCVDPFNSKTVYIVGNATIQKSTNGGSTWKVAGANVAGQVLSITMSPGDSKTILAGTFDGRAFVSTDAAATWRPIVGLPKSTGAVRTLLVGSGSPPDVLGAIGTGLLKGTTGGEPWHPVTQGLDAASIAMAAADPRTGSTLLATDGLGLLLRSEDSGLNWSRPDPAGATWFYRFAFSPTSPGTVLGGTDVGILRSEDDGASWQHTAIDGVLHTFVQAFGFQPGSAATVYSAANDGVRKSTDSGKTWTLTAAGQSSAYAVLADRVGSGVLYASYGLSSFYFYYYGYDQVTVQKSTDDGSTWTKADSGLPTESGFEGPYVSALSMDPSDSLTLYAGTLTHGVFKSADGARSWLPANTGIESAFVGSLVIDPAHPSALYALTGRGIYRSQDGAASWVPFNDGLANLAVTSLSIDATGHRLVAGTNGGGVYGMDIQPPSSCGDDEGHACYLGRFLVSASARPPSGNLAPLPVPVRQGDRFGSFRLGPDETLPSDIFLKVVDGRSMPGHAFWVFHAGLTSHGYALTVTDTVTGLSRVYQNGPGRPGCGGIDTLAFPSAGAADVSDTRGSTLSPGSGDTLALLGGRLSITLSVTDPRSGRSASGLAMPQDDRDGSFSLPDFTQDPAFPEVFVRVSQNPDGSFSFEHTGLTDLS